MKSDIKKTQLYYKETEKQSQNICNQSQLPSIIQGKHIVIVSRVHHLSLHEEFHNDDGNIKV